MNGPRVAGGESAGEAPSTDLLPGSIERYLATCVPICRRDATAGELRDSLVAAAHDSVADVAACTTEHPE